MQGFKPVGLYFHINSLDIPSMKYYETLFEEYIQSAKKYNLHPELASYFSKFPPNIKQLNNLIFYGPGGSGKYTQLLLFLEKYSPSRLKYINRITAAQADKGTAQHQKQKEKHVFTYKISDIHYEIDMSLLGVEPKKIWNTCYSEIVDIISMKPEKSGFIVCRNFHQVHSELLDVFYSYMQKSNTINNNIHIVFILLTEHVSYLPNNILDCCYLISVKRPSLDKYIDIIRQKQSLTCSTLNPAHGLHTQFINRIRSKKESIEYGQMQNAIQNINQLTPESIVNLKELQSLGLVSSLNKLPKDIFNIVCDNIIQQMENHQTLNYTEFRDHLYDILIYGLDITDCIWYILYYFIHHEYLKNADINAVTDYIDQFLKYYNNNFRPIYHLESMFFYLITIIHGYPSSRGHIRTY
jgi:hypothetical protein